MNSLRFRSLFVRLLCAQAVLLSVLALLAGLLLWAERSVLLSTPYAALWAPVLVQATGGSLTPSPLQAVQQKAQPPVSARQLISAMPGVLAFREALAARGVLVQEVRLDLASDGPTLWLLTADASGTTRWLGLPAPLDPPRWSARTVGGLALLVLLSVGMSWFFARRVARPLEHLRQRIQAHAPGQPAVAAKSDPSTLKGAASEIVAIDGAYAGLLARLQGFERERAVLLGGISHDLRSPMGRIRLAAEMLPETPDNAPGVQAIVRNVDEADRLIGSFLDFLRVGELPFDQTVDLSVAVRNAAAGFDLPASALSLQLPAAAAYPRANSLLLERLVANLIDNAFKHGRPPVSVSLETASEGWRLVVEDGGSGIDPALGAWLQEPFTRHSQSQQRPGTGLGLAIVSQVVFRLQGRIAFQPGPGRSRVCVDLPPR